MLSGVLQRAENPVFSAFSSVPHWNTRQPHGQRKVGWSSGVLTPVFWESNAPTKEYLGSKERRRQGWKSSLFILSGSWVWTSAPDQSTGHLHTDGHKMDQSQHWCCPCLGAWASSQEELVSFGVLEETSPSHSSRGKSAFIQQCLECGNFNAQGTFTHHEQRASISSSWWYHPCLICLLPTSPSPSPGISGALGTGDNPWKPPACWDSVGKLLQDLLIPINPLFMSSP